MTIPPIDPGSGAVAGGMSPVVDQARESSSNIGRILNAASLLGALLLALPKINLLSVSGETAGIRIDDVLTLCLAGTILWFPFHRAYAFRKIQIVLLLFSAVCVLSNIFNTLAFDRSSILYTLRILEYFTFGFFGYYYSRRHLIRNLAIGLASANGIVMLLQATHLMGGFASTSGLTSDVADRVIGLTGGPWEVGTVLNICMAILITDPTTSRPRKLVYFVLCLGLLLLTGARMPLLAHFYLIIVFLLRTARNKLKFIVSTVAVGACLVTGFILIPSRAAERSASTFNEGSLLALQSAYSYAAVPVSGPPIYFDFDDSDNSDASWLARTVKWSVATKTWLNNPVCWWIGVGPGFNGIALDGGWLRILTETGILGFGLFLLLLKRVSALHPAMKAVVVCLSINMLMIDVYISARVMPLFFFCVGTYAYLYENHPARPWRAARKVAFRWRMPRPLPSTTISNSLQLAERDRPA